MKEPDCYANFGTGPCDECEYAEWCNGAEDIPLLEESGRHWSYNERLDGWYWARAVEDDGGRLSKLLGELLHELTVTQASSLWEFLATMSVLSQQKPSAYKVVRARILNPQATYQELADMLDMFPQGVYQSLHACADMIPELRPAVVNPQKPMRKNKEERFSIKCTGNRITLRLDDVEFMSMPMNDKNNKSALPLVEALNNIHWRRRESLIEELEK